MLNFVNLFRGSFFLVFILESTKNRICHFYPFSIRGKKFLIKKSQKKFSSFFLWIFCWSLHSHRLIFCLYFLFVAFSNLPSCTLRRLRVSLFRLTLKNRLRCVALGKATIFSFLIEWVN